MKFFITLIFFSIGTGCSAQVNSNAVKDSIIAHRYSKDNYWYGTTFYDTTLIQKPSFRDRLDYYFNTLVAQKTDSVNKKMDWMLSYAGANKKTERYFLRYFVSRYFNSKSAWEDQVFIHLYQKFIAPKKYSWLPESEKKQLGNWAYRLMANAPGKPAANIESPDTAGIKKTLYSIKAPYTLVVIWDPMCDHCKEVLPKLDSLYNAKWKKNGLKIFALSMETQGKKNDWFVAIKSLHLQKWTHVYYSNADDSVRMANGKQGYAELYNVATFPAIYLLDKDKKIIAKNVTAEQVEGILRLRKPPKSP